MRRLYLTWLRFKCRVFRHDGAYTRTLQRAVARGSLRLARK